MSKSSPFIAFPPHETNRVVDPLEFIENLRESGAPPSRVHALWAVLSQVKKALSDTGVVLRLPGSDEFARTLLPPEEGCDPLAISEAAEFLISEVQGRIAENALQHALDHPDTPTSSWVRDTSGRHRVN